jgi:2,3-bisphosphoglycerate-independent phosphoglycerate mutase
MTPPLRIILLFADGVGIGPSDPEVNPLVKADLPVLRDLCGGSIFHRHHPRGATAKSVLQPMNATLGMPGLPQSGTGQTAIFTGVNGAKKFGRHFGPYPPSILRPTIAEKNVLRVLRDRGKTAVFANAFPQRFFEYVESGTRRLSVTTLACMLSDIPLLTAAELSRNEGVSADFTRARWPELGHPDVHPVTPAEAGRHLWQIAERHDFTLFEYWLTDYAGHSQSMPRSVEALEHLDEFLGGFFERFDQRDSLFMFVSDHGNIEDLSTKSHTRNPVPCILAGSRRLEVAPRLRALTHITPAILDLLSPL